MNRNEIQHDTPTMTSNVHLCYIRTYHGFDEKKRSGSLIQGGPPVSRTECQLQADNVLTELKDNEFSPLTVSKCR